MSIRSVTVIAAVLLGLGLPAAAQQAAADNQFNTGEPVVDEGPGSTYLLGKTGDWEIRCVRAVDGFDPCQLYQLLKDGAGNSVAELTMVALPGGAEAAAGATIVTPLETLLTAQITYSIDGGTPKRYPFTWCSMIGCFSRVGFTQAEVDLMKRGRQATMVIVPAVAPDQRVTLTVSLTGFTASYEQVKAKNAETQRLQEEAARNNPVPAPAPGGN